MSTLRITLGDAKDSRIGEVLNICSDDPAFVQILNEATERLLMRGRYWGTVARWNVCLDDSCLTLPVQIASVEKAAVCGHSIRIRDMWYEFLENGWGTSGGRRGGCSSCGGAFGSCGCSNGVMYRGNYPTFADIIGINKKLLAVCDLESDVDKEVLFLGYDENANWIRTDQAGIISDGQVVALSQAPGTQSGKKFSVVTDIQILDDLDGQWWMYEYNVDTGDQRMIGKYEYFEKRPSYPRYLFPICNSSTSNGNGSCNKTLVEIIGKLAFIPVKNDTDYLVISSLPALKEACMAIKYAEPPADIVKSEACMARAIRELDYQLQHQRGGTQPGVDIVGAGVGMVQPIDILI